MLLIGIAWRIVDIFLLGLGDTWLNVMPSKLFPLLITLAYFWRYRRTETSSVLGLSQFQLRSQIALGVLTGFSFYLLADAGGAILYSVLFDPTFTLDVHMVYGELIAYMLVFFFVNAVFEETLFRGLLQNGLKTRISANNAILISATVFGVWHVFWPIINGFEEQILAGQLIGMMFFTALLGVLFGLYYERFSSGATLVGPITIHTIINFMSEGFKIGPEPLIQGPDLAFANPTIMALSLTLAMILLCTLFLFVTRYKMYQLETKWSALLSRLSFLVDNVGE
jgi:membrane protease YdiL (CAAX protease family)